MATKTYDLISRTEIISPVYSIDLGPIPQTYSQLLVRVLFSTTNLDNNLYLKVGFNNDTTTEVTQVYSRAQSNSVTESTETTTDGSIVTQARANFPIPAFADFKLYDYSDTSSNKHGTYTFGFDVSSGDAETGYGGFHWKNDNAITSMQLDSTSGVDRFSYGTVISIYGIEA